MVEKTYKLDFDGYWREPNIGGLPPMSGIYCVYACTFNAPERTVSLNKLLYVGESGDIRARVKDHEKWRDWKRRLNSGQELAFNAALIAPQRDRERAEAATIFNHKPPCNVEFVHRFPYNKTTILTNGKNALLSPRFTVYPTE